MTNMSVENMTGQEILLLDTDVVAAHVPALRARLKALVAEGIRGLTMDLSKVRMVDSAGIGLIISTHNTLKKLGGTLELTGVSDELGDLFRSMRMHQHFRIAGAA